MPTQAVCKKCNEYIFSDGNPDVIETLYYDKNTKVFCIHYLHNGRFFLDYEGIVLAIADRGIYTLKMKSLEFICLLE